MQVLIEAAGQAHATPGSQGLSHLLPIKLKMILAFLPGISAGDKSLPHLLQELVHKQPLHLAADPGQVLARLSRILARIL